jgi:predicted dienelactone hydrolase
MNVPPDRTGGPYPVLLWSHGNGGTPWNATFFTTHLASHGFVVIAPLHPGNSAESCPQPCVDTYPPAQAARDEARANRPDDVMAVLDQALQASAGSDPLLAGLLDGQRVGVAGTSFGSQTALLVLARDARFRAAVATAPGAVPNLLAAVPSIAAPTMLLAGVLDDMNLFPQAETLFASFAPNQPPHWLVTLLRGGHFAFEDLCPPMSGGCDAESLPQEEAHALVNRWATAFLLRYVAGDERYAALLDPRTAGEEPEVRVSMEPSPY